MATKHCETMMSPEQSDTAGFDVPLTILHSFPTWLPLTQIWMYNQVKFLPPWVTNHIVCERTSNLELFSLPNLHEWAKEPYRYRLWDRMGRALRFRNHLRFYEKVATGSAIQILHSHFGPVGWHDLGVCRTANIKQVVTFYGQDVARLPKSDHRWYERYRELFAGVGAVLCEGPFMRDRVLELGCPPDKAWVHHLGVETGKIEYVPRAWRRGQVLRMLIAASFREKKGVPDALRAIAALSGKVDFMVTIIGDAGEDENSRAEKKRIVDTIAECGFGDKVRTLGYQPYDVLMAEAYQHHIFLQPSRTAADGDTEGGAPVSLIDMASSGIVLVSTRHCDIPEIIQEDITGLLADEGDVAGLGAHLLRLIDAPHTWGELTQRGRHRMEQEFDVTRQGHRLARLYANVIADNTGQSCQ